MSEKTDLHHAIHALAEAVSIPTVCDTSIHDYKPFDDFVLFLEKNWPVCFEHLEHSWINNYGLVFRLKGKNRDAAPLLLLTHYDVPTVVRSAEWTDDPFGYTVHDGAVWGIGASGNKLEIIALFETLNRFVTAQKQPERDIYVALGFDQHAGGSLGASRIASFLQSQNLHFDTILAGGGCVLPPIAGFSSRPLSLIGVNEAKYVRIRITVTQKNAVNPIYALSKILAHLKDNHGPVILTSTIRMFLKKISSDLSGRQRYRFEHPDFFKGSIYKILAQEPFMLSMFKNTLEPISISSKGTDDSMPESVSVIIDCKLNNDDLTFLADLQKLIPEIPCKVDVLSDLPATPLSKTDTLAYERLKACISVIFPETETVPFSLVKPTDTRYYTSLSDAVYYFSPVLCSSDYLQSKSITNEHVTIEQVFKAIDFYTTFIQNFQ